LTWNLSRATTALLLLVVPMLAVAHNVSQSNASFVETIDGPAVVPFLYLGAKHMTTGYDHLLYLVGVVFFLYRGRDILLYVTLFTVGHSITLLAGVLGGLTVNAFVIDAIIGLSIVYKAFENMGGFERVLGFRPDMRAAVLVFGLCHGLGLATKLQALTLADDGLVTNMLSFNVGVELGQILALVFVLLILVRWRRHASFRRHAFATNTVLMAGGFLLAGYQITGYLVAPCC
jgi:hypothetical protein